MAILPNADGFSPTDAPADTLAADLRAQALVFVTLAAELGAVAAEIADLAAQIADAGEYGPGSVT